jgi:hypothetical protein
VFTREFLVTPLGVEYSGVLGLDILRQMEPKVDLCSGGLIIGRRRYELAGLECQDRSSPQVKSMKPVAGNEWSASDLINPTDSARNEQATGKQGAGGLASLNCRELNPDCPASHDTPNNILSIVSAQMVLLPQKSRFVAVGRMSGNRQGQDPPRVILVEPVPTMNSGMYVT